MPSKSLLQALDNFAEKSVLRELKDFALADIAALRNNLEELFEQHASATMVPTPALNWIQCLILLGCQKKRDLKKTLTRLHERYRCDAGMMGGILLQLLERFDWPLEDALAEYSLPKSYPHSWEIAFQLVEAGRVKKPDVAGWLNWMPDGFSHRTTRYGECGISTLQNESSLLSLVEDFFRSSSVGVIPSIYAASQREVVGVGDKPPTHSELTTDKDWSHFSRYCIGVSLYGLAVRGQYDMEKVRSLFFGALPSVAKTPAARWLTGLVDLACDNDDLQRRGVQQFVEHNSKAVAKWAAKKLTQ